MKKYVSKKKNIYYIQREDIYLLSFIEISEGQFIAFSCKRLFIHYIIILQEKNDFAERSIILAGYRSEK